MLKSLDLINTYINDIKRCKVHRVDGLTEFAVLHLNELQLIKQDLEVFNLIIKWKNMIHFKPDPEFLNDEEYNVMVSELKFIEKYLNHHLGYIPICFKEKIKSLRVGDNHD